MGARTARSDDGPATGLRVLSSQLICAVPSRHVRDAPGSKGAGRVVAGSVGQALQTSCASSAQASSIDETGAGAGAGVLRMPYEKALAADAVRKAISRLDEL